DDPLLQALRGTASLVRRLLLLCRLSRTLGRRRPEYVDQGARRTAWQVTVACQDRTRVRALGLQSGRGIQGLILHCRRHERTGAFVRSTRRIALSGISHEVDDALPHLLGP